jgi:predicted branched-subunit amino acid permease
MKKNSFLQGLYGGIPICLGYVSVAFAFGIFAVDSGLSVAEALLISMSCVTSAGQLAAVPIIAGGGGLIELAVSQLVINLRYSLMSISLSQKFDGTVKFLDRFAIAFVNTDEVFAVASSQKGSVSKAFMYGLMATPWLGWACGTLLGAVAGNILPAIVTSALGVAIYGMFIAIVVPEAKKSRSTALCVAIAVALSFLFYYVPGLNSIPSGFTVILCAVTASLIMALAAPISEEVDADA